MQEGGKAQGDQYARRRAGCLMSSAGDLVDDWCKALGGSARPHLLCLDEAALSAMGRGAPTEVARGNLSRTNSSASGSSGSHTGPRTTAKTEAASTFKAALRAASVGALPPVSGRAAASVSDTVAEAKPDDLNDLNRTASETAVELAQTASSELAKPEPCSVAAIQTASGTGVEPAKTSASEPAKPEPFSMAAMMERARRKAQEKREEDEARARGETFHRAPSNEDSAMDAHLRTHKERQNDLQNRLKGLTKSLKRFDVRAAEAEIEHERVRQQARATAAQMWKGLNGAKVKKACAFDLAPPDMIMKILSFLSGPKLFITLSTSRRFQCLDAEFWIELISREHADPIPLEPLSTRQLREIYRDKAERWSRLMCTYDWLKKQGCPSDVHGARKGPWSKVTLSHVLQDTVACTGHQAAIWRRRAIMPYLRCITCLVGSSHEGIRVLAASALANLVRHSDCGRDVLDKHAVMKPLQTMLYSNSLGQQKQATRAMINAWVDDEVAVRVGCDASYLNAPFRHTPSTGVRNVEWLCIDFSPSGKMNPAYTISMSTQYGADSAVGRLQGHGEDSMGQFKICEATLNRSLQWMSGTCLDDDDRFQAERPLDVIAQEGPPTDSAALKRVSSGSSHAETHEMLLAAGRSTPKELPQIVAKFKAASLDGARSGKIAFGEMVDRVAGFQYRYQSQLTSGKLLNVDGGAEYMELLKTYQNGHGDDHVRLLAFADERGLWGMWERGRYQYQHKMDECTRGAFRMWQIS